MADVEVIFSAPPVQIVTSGGIQSVTTSVPSPSHSPPISFPFFADSQKGCGQNSDQRPLIFNLAGFCKRHAPPQNQEEWELCAFQSTSCSIC